MRNKLVSFCMAMVILMTFACIPTNAREDASKGIYLVLGDSISTGLGLENPERECFASLVADELELALVNEARNNSTAKDVLKKLQDGGLDEDIKEASLITLTCGGNDLMNLLYREIAVAYNKRHQTDYTDSDVFRVLRGQSQEIPMSRLIPVAVSVLPTFVERTEFKNELASYRETVFGKDGIVSYLRAHNQNAVILIASQYNPYQSVGGLFKILNTSVDAGAKALNRTIREGAKETQCLFSDVYTAFSRYQMNLCNCHITLKDMNFDFHPNSDGHRVIADTIIDSYRALDFGVCGYQMGQNGVRLVGYIDTLRYDRLEMQVVLSETNETVIPITTVSKTMYGTVDGNISAVVTCDELTEAAYTLPKEYLFGCELEGFLPGQYTVMAQPKAQKDGLILYGKSISFVIDVSDIGQITVIE